jgi:hypothetical protein
MYYCLGKLTKLVVIVIALPSVGLANDPSYHDEITAVTNRYVALANRKALGGILSPAEDKERQCLLGQLIEQNPVWALTNEIVADAQALKQGKPEERAAANKLLELAAITGGFQLRATTLAEAESFASILREFVVRRDVEGAREWAKAQTLPP